MGIVSEAFRRLEAERNMPKAEIRRVVSMSPPPGLGRCTRHVAVVSTGTLREMEAELVVRARSFGAKPYRRRGQLRFDVVYPIAYEKISYFVKGIEG